MGQRTWQSRKKLTVRQNNTKYAAGTLPLNMYRKELPVGERVDDQLSEYDSNSSDEEDGVTNEEEAVDTVPVNFLSRTVRTRTGRAITLSHQALSSY